MLPYFRHNEMTLTDFQHTLESDGEDTLAVSVPVLNNGRTVKMYCCSAHAFKAHTSGASPKRCLGINLKQQENVRSR